jgi:hypothetical protein
MTAQQAALEKLTVPQAVKEFPAFLENSSRFLPSKKPAISTYSEPDESTTCRYILYIYDPL